MHCGWSRRTAVVATLKQLGIQDVVTGFERRINAPEVEHCELPPDFITLHDAGELDKQALDYILGRGITMDQLKSHGIGVSYSGRYAYRIVFPVYADGELKCFNTRDFTGRRKPKYLLSKGDKYLAYFDPSATSCVLSEGVIKAMRIEQATTSASAALLGHDLTDNQLSQVSRSSCQLIVLWPDGDLVGRRGFIKIADKLSASWGGDVSMVWPVAGPADELPRLAIKFHLMSRTQSYTARVRHRMLLDK